MVVAVVVVEPQQQQQQLQQHNSAQPLLELLHLPILLITNDCFCTAALCTWRPIRASANLPRMLICGRVCTCCCNGHRYFCGYDHHGRHDLDLTKSKVANSLQVCRETSSTRHSAVFGYNQQMISKFRNGDTS